MNRDSEVFATVVVDGSQQEVFVGEIFMYEDVNTLAVCTPEADYIFTLTEVINK